MAFFKGFCNKRFEKLKFLAILVTFIPGIIPTIGLCENARQSIERMDSDAKQGKPLIAHVVVALADNKSQSIVPISPALGNGDSPRTNLYWGALYGVKTFFSRSKNWTRIKADKPNNPSILERVVFTAKLMRNGSEVIVYVVADAWQGDKIKTATERFIELSAGKYPEPVSLLQDGKNLEINAGGDAHLVSYIGHNGLMDFSIPSLVNPAEQYTPKSAIVLACYSQNYFADKLNQSGSHSLLTTNGLMAPEAYTLEAALVSWFSGYSTSETHLAAAKAYSRYQKAKISWAKGLFSTNE